MRARSMSTILGDVRPVVPRWFVRAYAALLGAGAALVLAVAVLVSPDDLESGRVVLTAPCPIRARTGHDCPSCGLTRGVAAVGHGEWSRALQYNRASPAVLGLSLLIVLGACAVAARR